MPSPKRPVRIAAYLRFSHEEQRGNNSLDVQLRLVTNWITSQGAILANVYTDEARSGKTVNRRDAFKEMLADAKDGAFDAVCVAYWSRLNRNKLDARTIKAQLRRDYNIAVYSATEPSEHDGAMGGFVESIMEANAQFYVAARYPAGDPDE